MAGKSPLISTENDRKELRRLASSGQNLGRKRVIWSRIFNFANTSVRSCAGHAAALGTLLLCTEEYIAEIHRLRRLRALSRHWTPSGTPIGRANVAAHIFLT